MISNEAVEAARQALHRVRWERMKRMIEGDRRALGEREPGDPPDMQEDARAALEAAAPHMLPAPEGVSEAKRDVADLIGRIIAARDDMKRHFASHYVLSVMADAANAIVGQEALLKAENAARLDLQNLAADECARADKMRDLLTRAREYVTDALDAHEHSDGRDLLKEIDAALRWTQGEGE